MILHIIRQSCLLQIYWNDNGEFFNFTRGRFLRDKSHQLSQCHIRFNIDELAQLAVHTTQLTSPGARRCVNIEKLADGMHNKAVRFTMDNGFQAVGKVPNLNAGKPHFTTASEMKNVMGTPVPKVFSWSSTADNTVGAEYILMENIQEMKMKVLRKIMSYQENWVRTCFSGMAIVDKRFAVGPSVSRQNNDDGRVDIDFDRGPWNSAEDYERATGFRKLQCIRYMPRLPKSPFAIYYSRTNPSEILGIIDWQSIKLAPLYDHTIEPYILDYDGPPLDGLLERPKLANIPNRKANLLFIKMSLVSLYRHLICKRIPQLFKVLEFRETPPFQLLLFARNLPVDREATYLRGIPRLNQEDTKSPIYFTADMLYRIDMDHTGADSAIKLMQEAQEMMGQGFFYAGGLVSHEEFSETRQIIPRVKTEFIQKHARNTEEAVELEHAWPFE
ncbi:hypothetical protein BDV33DRAFT_228987 [Aspergillus novoparasiticus]|uniref:Aminoglycoside phosphotransferase domain-containing protein n=1 Tax=Aspergillus novoparasiticus TaxID=986946 RepID=A0A5N6F072_9EURO|nr:hypothetical protein BDV33DRAFT_228987 [Aspergillus novoparasiticus]